MAAAALSPPPYNPYLCGAYAPAEREIATGALPVIGEIPRDLHGAYFRNGADPIAPPAGLHHWFDGEGMIHGVWFENGAARYANRRILGEHTRAALAGKPNPGGIFYPAAGAGDERVYRDTANTDLVIHRGKILALWYISGIPVLVDPDRLETIRDETFGGALPRCASAHSKVDPETGELVFFDYSLHEPWMAHGTISADGELTHFRRVELPGPRLPHDMGLTRNYVILHDLPLIFSQKAIARRTWQVHFAPQATRFGVARRDGVGQVRWFETEPCYIYHVAHAWEEGDEVVMLACKMVSNGMAPDAARFGAYAPMVNVLALHAVLFEWRFDMITGEVKERQLDDQIAEFPVADYRRMGAKARYLYLTSMAPGDMLRHDGLIGYDLAAGASVRHHFAAGTFGSEPAFAPRLGSVGENDGYLITFAVNHETGASEALVIDAQNLSAPPLARVPLPQRVPAGFHGVWAPGEILAPWAGAKA